MSECINWTGWLDPQGYGRIKTRMAHRVIYERQYGPLPAELVIDHLCRNPSCVNTAHMEPVTRRENTLRGNGPAAQNAAKTMCKRGHDFTPGNTYLHGGSRRCRACNRARSAAYLAKKAAAGEAS